MRSYCRRLPRNTTSPPASKVNPAIADDGSISGAAMVPGPEGARPGGMGNTGNEGCAGGAGNKGGTPGPPPPTPTGFKLTALAAPVMAINNAAVKIDFFILPSPSTNHPHGCQ